MVWVRTRIHIAKGEELFEKFKNYLSIPQANTHIICDALMNLDSGVYMMSYPSGGYNEATMIGNVNDPTGAVISSTLHTQFRSFITTYADLSRLDDYTGPLPRPMPPVGVQTQELEATQLPANIPEA